MSFIQCHIISHKNDRVQFLSTRLKTKVLESSKIAPNTLMFSRDVKSLSSIESHNKPPDSPKGSCRECLITGVLTCTGLSLYFIKLASELPRLSSKEATKQMKRQKYFLYTGSAVWATAGIYRLYLD